jgi:prophage regulatory protein
MCLQSLVMFTNAHGGKDMTTSTQSYPYTTIPSNDRVLRWPEVQLRVGICRSHVHNLVSQGKFPSPIKLGARASGWLESEVNTWLENQVSNSRSQEG